jgi:hypothetical protein
MYDGKSTRSGGTEARDPAVDHVAGSDRLRRVLSSWTEAAKRCRLCGDAWNGVGETIAGRLIRLPASLELPGVRINSSWFVMIEEMLGGQHRNDAATQSRA